MTNTFAVEFTLWADSGYPEFRRWVIQTVKRELVASDYETAKIGAEALARVIYSQSQDDFITAIEAGFPGDDVAEVEISSLYVVEGPLAVAVKAADEFPYISDLVHVGVEAHIEGWVEQKAREAGVDESLIWQAINIRTAYEENCGSHSPSASRG
jgi:hypothetical protein